jgi:hypothetical protein
MENVYNIGRIIDVRGNYSSPLRDLNSLRLCRFDVREVSDFPRRRPSSFGGCAALSVSKPMS